jgi:carbon storage regulator CsrA
MLVLTRRIGEKITIGEETFLTVRSISASRVWLAVDAPIHTSILRGELTIRMQSPETSDDEAPTPIGSVSTPIAPLRDYHPSNRVNNG